MEHILSEFKSGKRLIEPFTGSGAVFMNANFSDYLLAEINKDLIYLFKHLQRDGESFISYCAQFFTDTTNTSEYYYALRSDFNQETDERLRAAMFLYLNRHGYNGLCRYNNSGGYNVPFGRYLKPYFPQTEMRLFYQKSQKATFIHSDYRETFALAKKGDLIYCDPPYSPLKQKTNFSKYADQVFSEEDQIILAELAKGAANRGITVIISNHDTDFTRAQYTNAKIKSFEVSRSISCLADNRDPVKEIVAIFSP